MGDHLVNFVSHKFERTLFSKCPGAKAAILNRKRSMPSLIILLVLILGTTGCCGMGRQRQFTKPSWDVSALTNSNSQTTNGFKWTHTPVTIRPMDKAFVSGTEFLGTNDLIHVDITMQKFRDPANSKKTYDRRKDRGGAPLYCRGSSYGYEYSITKSVRPRNDPEGGYFYQDKRITYLTMQKNVTVIFATISSRGAKNQVDVSEIVREINKLVGEW